MRRLLLILALLAFAGTAQAQITVVQHTSDFCVFPVTCATLSKAYSVNNTAGNALIALIFQDDLVMAPPFQNVTDTAGNTWTFDVSQGVKCGGAILGASCLWYTCNAVGGANTVTVDSESVNRYLHLHLYEVSGLPTTNCFGRSAYKVFGPSPSPVSAQVSVPACRNSGFAIALVVHRNANTIWGGAGAGDTVGETVQNPTPNSSQSQYQNATTSLSGIQTITFTYGGAPANAFWVAAFFQGPNICSGVKHKRQEY